MEERRVLPRVQEPVSEHSHTVIFLHGGGSDGPQLWRAINRMRPSLFACFPSFRWVFPSANLQWSSSLEMERSQWFDASPQDSSQNSEVIRGLDTSVTYVLKLVHDEMLRLGGRADRLVLAGISQGQATALQALLCCGHKLGAFFGMSGWLPLAHKLEGMDLGTASKYLREKLGLLNELGTPVHGTCAGTPVFLGHGTYDRKVPLNLALRARHVLKGMNMEVSWHQYVGAKIDGHWIKLPEELDDVVEFLDTKLKIDNGQPSSE